MEDELHILRICSAYHDFRSNLKEELKTNLFADLVQAFKQTKEMGRYVKKVLSRRFPEDKNQAKKKKTKNENHQADQR